MVQPAEQAVPLVQEGSPQEADAEGQKTAEKPEIQEEVGGETPTEIQGETGETGETGENGQSPAEPPRSSVEAAFGQEVREQEVREQEISEQENAKDSPATNHSPETEQTSQVVAFPTGQQVDAQPPAPDSTEQQDQPATISTPASRPRLNKSRPPRCPARYPRGIPRTRRRTPCFALLGNPLFCPPPNQARGRAAALPPARYGAVAPYLRPSCAKMV